MLLLLLLSVHVCSACFVNGTWRYDAKANVAYRSTLNWENCDAPGVVAERHKWKWTPYASPTCGPFREFDAARFCQSLVRADGSVCNVLFVGDSISRLMFVSLAYLVGTDPYVDTLAKHPDLVRRQCPIAGPPPLPERIQGDLRQHDHDAAICGAYLNTSACAFHVRSDHLGSMPSHYDNFPHTPETGAFLQQFGVVVLNTGAHYVENYTAVIQEGAEFFGTYLRDDALLFYRTAVPGHVHPLRDASQRPFNSLHDAESHLTLHPANPSWHYQHFQLENNRATAAFAQCCNATVIDAYSVSAMQWAGHVDPLHYCLPGPPDLWNQMMYNYLISA